MTTGSESQEPDKAEASILASREEYVREGNHVEVVGFGLEIACLRR